MVINQPITQIRLTNVAVVRLSKGGTRFEVACYPNKVRDWRKGLELDISEVLQSDKIFTNVSKGRFASDAEMKKEFGTTDVNEVTKIILTKGSVQVSEKERRLLAAEFHKEVCTIAASRLISKATKLPLTPAMLENCLKQIRYRPKFTQGASAKAAVAKVISRLFAKLPDQLIHALMKAQITCEKEDQEKLELFLDKELGAQRLDVTENDGKVTVTYRAAPCDWHKQEKFVSEVLSSRATLYVICMYDETTPESLPNHAALAGGVSKGTRKDKNIDGDDENHEASSESEGDDFDEDSESGTDEDDVSAEEDTAVTRGKHAAGFAALIESGDDEDSSVENEESGDDKLPPVEELLKPAVAEKPRAKKRIDLETNDTKDRKRQIKERERKERDRERKEAEQAKQEKLAREAAHRKSVEEAAARQASEKVNAKDDQVNSATWCLVCQADYALLSANLRVHVKSEWHQLNQKRKVRNLDPVSQAEFEDLARDVRDGFLAVEY